MKRLKHRQTDILVRAPVVYNTITTGQPPSQQEYSSASTPYQFFNWLNIILIKEVIQKI